jgi:hypothetical protein
VIYVKSTAKRRRRKNWQRRRTTSNRRQDPRGLENKRNEDDGKGNAQAISVSFCGINN